MSPSRAGSSQSSSWRIFSSAWLGSWPFCLQLEIENRPKRAEIFILFKFFLFIFSFLYLNHSFQLPKSPFFLYKLSCNWLELVVIMILVEIWKFDCTSKKNCILYIFYKLSFEIDKEAYIKQQKIRTLKILIWKIWFWCLVFNFRILFRLIQFQYESFIQSPESKNPGNSITNSIKGTCLEPLSLSQNLSGIVHIVHRGRWGHCDSCCRTISRL